MSFAYLAVALLGRCLAGIHKEKHFLEKQYFYRKEYTRTDIRQFWTYQNFSIRKLFT